MKSAIGFISLICLSTALPADFSQAEQAADKPAAVIKAFQDAVKRGDYRAAWEILAPKLQEEGRGYAAFDRALRKPGVSGKIAGFRVECVRTKGNRVLVFTDCAEPGLQVFELMKLDGRWRIVSVGTQARPVYADGQEKEFARAAWQYAGVAVEWFRVKDLLEQTERLLLYRSSRMPEKDQQFFDEKRRRLEVADALEAAQRQLAEYHDIYALAHKQENIKPFASELDRLYRTLLRQLASLKKKTSAVLTREKRDLSAEAVESSPRPPSTLIARSEFARHLFFGPVARWWRYEGWDAFSPLGFDFVCIDTGWGSARVGKTPEGERDFSRMDELVRENAASGYKSDIGQAGLGPLDFNIWDPAERETWTGYFRALGEHYRDNPNVLCYELFNEPDLHNYNPDAPGSEFVRKAFRKYLAEKFRSISTLNRVCGSEYRSFEEILPPVGEPRLRLTPLDYEFHRFRRLSLARFLWMCCDTLKSADPNHPVMSQITEFGGRQDAFLVGSRSFDIFSIHMTFGGGPGGENNMNQVYSLNRFIGNPQWQEEFIFNNPEARENADETVLSAAIRRNIWQALALGMTGIEFFELDGFWKGWNNYVLDREFAYGIIRPSSAIIRTALDKARRLEKILVNTEIVQPKIGILDSPTTRIVPGLRGRNWRQSEILERLFTKHFYGYFFLPEAGLHLKVSEIILTEGKLAARYERPKESAANLDDYKLIFLPRTGHILGAASNALLDFVRRGGTLAALGADAGKYNEYGRPSSLSTSLTSALSNPQNVGRGRIIVFPKGIELRADAEKLLALVSETVPEREAWCENPVPVQLVLRENGERKRYLLAINLDAKKEVRPVIWLNDFCPRVLDLTVAEGVKVSTEMCGGRSRFVTHLAPGATAIFELLPLQIAPLPVSPSAEM